MSRDPFHALVVSPSPAAPAASAPAVEVVTALGDSVLEVAQLQAAPPRSARARLCMTLGAGLLLAAATTFALGVRDAARDAAARDAWTAAQRPAWAFRATRHAASADLLALGGALAGLGLCATGLLLARRPARTSFRVGVGDDVDVPLADAGRAHTLVQSDGAGGFVVDVGGLTGELRSAGRSVSFAELQATGQLQVPVRGDMHARAQLGRTTFHVRGVALPARPVGPAPFLRERGALTFVAASAAVHLGLLGMMSLATPEQETVPGELRVDETNYLNASITAPDDPIPPPPEDGDGETGTAVASVAPSMALTDGRLGHDDGSVTPARLQVANRAMIPRMSREQAIAAASEAGVLGAMQAVGPIRAFDGVDIASGIDAIDFAGGMVDGGGDGVPVGSFGWGVAGFGTGCGTLDGKLCQGIKAGAFATIGESGRDGRNWRGLSGFGPGTGKRVATAPTVKPCSGGTCTVAPELDAATIRRYVHRNLNKIKYCYEKELLAAPGLEGTVTANFTLDGNGHVVDSRASGVSPAVSTCVAGVLANISFPRVAEPGIYPIKYPFTFRPTGS
jgi:hypothetical protein